MLALFAAASGEQSTPYIEQVFSTYLYEGNGATQTITNGIDLSTKGGLVWLKSRGIVQDHGLTDTVRGADKFLRSNTTAAQQTIATGITSFNANGFSIGSTFNSNTPPATYVSWTFREQPKFFDVVTYTGTGSNTTIAHSLDSVPGCIIVKRTDTTADWAVYHRSLANTQYLVLNSTAAAATGATWWNSTTPTSTVFSVGTDASVNASGGTYVAYLFAHDAGGFGLTGTDNIISCGSATPNLATFEATINLGWEPQWVLTKSTAAVGSWLLTDNMRGMTVLGSEDSILRPNLSDAENTSNVIGITSTGFITQSYGTDFIYIAIRRGPMEIPTVGTTVFSPTAVTNSQGVENTTGFPLDMQIANIRSGFANNGVVPSRLTGVSSNTTSSGSYLRTSSTNAETTGSNITQYWGNTGFQTASNWAGSGMSYWNFQRAPSFFDEVCWTGDATNPRSISHNLIVAPTLIITKKRNSTSNWITGYDFAATTYKYFNLNDTAAATSDTYASSPVYGGNPTSSVFIVGNQGNMNQSGDTYVSYLFASCLGVSKVGSYTGTATTQQINCNFNTGARFVLIKRTDSTGDWYVWDSARGIVAGNDPYLLLNSNAAEVTSTNYVDAYAAGFELTSTAPAAINANGGTYIFLAIA